MHYSDASTAQRSALRFAIAAQQFTEAGAPDFDQIEQAEFAHIGAGNDVSRPERRQETIPRCTRCRYSNQPIADAVLLSPN